MSYADRHRTSSRASMNQIDLRRGDASHAAAGQQELAGIIERYCGADGAHPTPIPGLSFYRLSSPSMPACAVVKSVFAVIAQGAKRVVLAEEAYEYDSGHYLITSVGLPLL